jgi:thiamine biosynthesis lipoprotein
VGPPDLRRGTPEGCDHHARAEATCDRKPIVTTRRVELTRGFDDLDAAGVGHPGHTDAVTIGRRHRPDSAATGAFALPLRPRADSPRARHSTHHSSGHQPTRADRHHTSATSATSLQRNEMPVIDTATIGARDGYWTQRLARAMGSEAHIVVGDAPAGVLDWAFSELERLEQCWSRFRSDSELAHVNASRGSWTDVSASMLLALTCAADLHRATAGAFDPTIIDALEAAGYDRTFEQLARDAPTPAVAKATTVPGFATVEIDEARSRVRLPHGTRLDLGGVGKGLAADLIARGLVDRGARTVLVGMGGDLRARGTPPPAGSWDVPVLDPFDETRVSFRFPLVEGAIVTSTTRIRAWTRGARRHHHLVDPATGDSARTGVTAVVAAAPDAWWAEGIAKSIIVSGETRGLALARVAGVRAWIFGDDARMVEACSPS